MCTCTKACCASHSNFGLYGSLVLVVRMFLEFGSVLQACLKCHHTHKNRLCFVVVRMTFCCEIKYFVDTRIQFNVS